MLVLHVYAVGAAIMLVLLLVAKSRLGPPLRRLDWGDCLGLSAIWPLPAALMALLFLLEACAACSRMLRAPARTVARPRLRHVIGMPLANAAEATRPRESRPIVCRTCGGRDLEPDPGGYYGDAEDEEGRPLLCRSCNNRGTATPSD